MEEPCGGGCYCIFYHRTRYVVVGNRNSFLTCMVLTSAACVGPPKQASNVAGLQPALCACSHVQANPNPTRTAQPCPANLRSLAHAHDTPQAMANPELVKQALAAGFTCQITSSGDDILRYWDFSIDARRAALILLGFYAALNLASYITLTRMYRQKR